MSLMSEQMLPERIRSMRQMKEILEAEEGVLQIIEMDIESMYKRAELLHEELVNEIWLKKHLEDLFGGMADVRKTLDMLQVEFYLNIDKMTDAKERAVEAFLNKWLPAHLAYTVSYDRALSAAIFLALVWQDDAMIIIKQKERDKYGL